MKKSYHRCYICYESLSSDEHHYHPACLKTLFNTPTLPTLDFNENELTLLAEKLTKQKMGLPGVQQKLSLNLQQPAKKSHQPYRLTLIGYLGGQYILKPPTPQYPFMPEVEDLTMHLANIADIPVAQHGLIPLDGKLAYITKRFDRKGNEKIAVEDLCQLSKKRTEDKYRSSSEQVGKTIALYTTFPGNALVEYFKLIVFSFVVGNADMHLKNFSLITENLNHIHMAPCYDLLSTKLLIPTTQDPEELALPVNGKKSNLRKKDFITLGENLKIPTKTMMHILKSMIANEPIWQQKIADSFLPDEMKQKLNQLIHKNLKTIQGSIVP